LVGARLIVCLPEVVMPVSISLRSLAVGAAAAVVVAGAYAGGHSASA
jgi:hypothetical protein